MEGQENENWTLCAVKKVQLEICILPPELSSVTQMRHLGTKRKRILDGKLLFVEMTLGK